MASVQGKMEAKPLPCSTLDGEGEDEVGDVVEDVAHLPARAAAQWLLILGLNFYPRCNSECLYSALFVISIL